MLSSRGEGLYDLWYRGKVLDSSEKVWPNGELTSSLHKKLENDTSKLRLPP
jgi:hypothetical protein